MNVLDALPVAVLQVSREGRVQYFNERARQLLGPVGLEVGEDVAVVLAPLAELDASQGRAKRPSIMVGEDRVIGFQATTLDDGSRVVAFQDITHMEQTRQERDRLLQLASISDVMPAVLHELKNPLAGITAGLEVLVEDCAPGDMQQRLHALLTEVRRLGLTIDGLGRFRHEVKSARHWAIDVAIREAFQLLAPQAESRGVHAAAEVSDMPLLPLEPAAIRAVVFNLVTNAIHACRHGDRLLVKAGFDRATGTLGLLVDDTGSGMTDEVRRRCTELFFTTKPKGSGIGLALCRGVAEAVGGRLVVESAPGRGTTVELTLPVQFTTTSPTRSPCPAPMT